MTAPERPQWRPDLDAAVSALAGELGPHFAAEFHKELTDDARAVLDASGANAEIRRLRAILAGAHAVISFQRTWLDEIHEQPIDAQRFKSEAERAEAWRRFKAGDASTYAPNAASDELISDPGPDVMSMAVADMARAERQAFAEWMRGWAP